MLFGIFISVRVSDNDATVAILLTRYRARFFLCLIHQDWGDIFSQVLHHYISHYVKKKTGEYRKSIVGPDSSPFPNLSSLATNNILDAHPVLSEDSPTSLPANTTNGPDQSVSDGSSGLDDHPKSRTEMVGKYFITQLWPHISERDQQFVKGTPSHSLFFSVNYDDSPRRQVICRSVSSVFDCAVCLG